MRAAIAQWVWLDAAVLKAVHEEQLAEHGGPPSVRDEGLLGSALQRPRERVHNAEPDAAQLAAGYAFDIARHHPFVDGNLRTAFVAAELFLALNGYELRASDADCVIAMLDLASGHSDEASCAAWLRSRIVKR